MEKGEQVLREGKSFEETPTWAVATVITVMVSFGFLVHHSLRKFGHWLEKTKRKPLLAALDKIKEELMLFGVLSLLMGHWISFFSKICIKSSAMDSRFYPCVKASHRVKLQQLVVSSSKYSVRFNSSVFRKLKEARGRHHGYCPEGKYAFASHESLEQLHHFVFVLGVTHVSYSFIAIALAMIKIYSWRTWENHAKTMAAEHLQESAATEEVGMKMSRLTTFISHHVSHPWSQSRVLVWLLCFSRQFWSSINQADYMALRVGFITTHELPLTYDFHNYMVRSMEEEFREIVGIRYCIYSAYPSGFIAYYVSFLISMVIFCVLRNYSMHYLPHQIATAHISLAIVVFAHLLPGFVLVSGTHIYFWLSFLPAIVRLHRCIAPLLLDVTATYAFHPFLIFFIVFAFSSVVDEGFRKFNLRDELFWLGRPRFLLRLIQLISFQNAFEMASFLWSLWEIKDPACFMSNQAFLVTRLACSIISQCWCSFITFPLYVIVTQMGSKFKSAVVSENVRDALSNWKRSVKGKHGSSNQQPKESHSTSSLDSMGTDINRAQGVGTSRHGQSTPRGKDTASPSQPLIEQESSSSPKGKNLKTPLSFYFKDDCTLCYDDDGDDDMSTDFDAEDEIHRIEP